MGYQKRDLRRCRCLERGDSHGRESSICLRARLWLVHVTELFARFGISRKTGYKWLRRYAECEVDGLRDRSRTALKCPHRTTRDIEARLAHSLSPGTKKLVAWLRSMHPEVQWPEPSAAGEIVKRAGLIAPWTRRSKPVHPGRSVVEMKAPNYVWTVDFKGQLRVRDGQYCYPLTVVDGVSPII